MSFTFNKETRRSLRDRIRDGINLIPGASSVVQAPANILDPKKHGQPPQPGTNLQKKSHSVDSSSPNLLVSEEMSMMKPPLQHPPSSPSYLTADGAADDHGGGGGGATGSVDGNATSRSGSLSSSSSTGSSPSKYRTYVVKSNDTVTSIAASYDCTPSELLRVNRLITARVLFPGQVLKIPNKRTITGVNSGPATPPPAPQQQQQQRDDAATASMLETLTYAQRKFLKVKVRHVTDGNGVVSGTLLITPNAVMFDGDVMDPLVIEQGAETYGIILPIEYIIAASIWSDICGMKVRGKEAFVPPGPKPALWGLDPGECNKPVAAAAGEQGSIKSESSGEEPCVNSGGEAELPEKKLDVVIESPQSSEGGDTALESETTTIEGSSDEPEQNSQGSEDGGSGSSSAAAAAKLPREEVTDHPLKDPGSVIHTWYFCLTIGRPTKGGNGDATKGGCRSPRNPFCFTYGQKNIVRPEFWFSVNREQVPELYKYWMFWWPHLYGEIEKQVITDRGYVPVDWDNLDITQEQGTANAGGTGATRGSNDDEEQSMAQELNELTKESWEMLKQPYSKLSSFITTRGSSIMKSSSHSSQSSVSEAQTTHLHHPVGHQHQPSSSSTTSLFNSHHFSITNPMNSFFFDSFSNISPNHSVFDDTDDDDEEFADSSFEQVVTNEELRNLLAMGGEEMMTINLPDLIGGKSDILEEEDMRNITRHLTARAEGYPWTLIFTSSRDGFSLNSLYRRNMLMQEESPVIVLVQDTNSRVFGALVSCSLHPSDSFYGTGQSFLFSLRPEFHVYKWTGENLFFVKGNHDGIWIGAGDGKFGLYVDGDLNCGRTESCQTYGNPPLTEPQDFIIKTLECWAFGNFVLSTGNEGVGEGVCK